MMSDLPCAPSESKFGLHAVREAGTGRFRVTFDPDRRHAIGEDAMRAGVEAAGSELARIRKEGRLD